MIENERNYWNNTIIKTEIKIPNICTNCNLNEIYITNGDTLIQ